MVLCCAANHLRNAWFVEKKKYINVHVYVTMVFREKEIHGCPRLCYSGFMRCTALMKRVMLLMGPSGKPKVWYQRSGDKTMDLDERYLHRKM